MAWIWPMRGGLEGALENIRSPQIDIIDRDKDILIRVEVPGVEKKNIDVSVSNGTLNIGQTSGRDVLYSGKGLFGG